jgi:hypothetical protein
MPGTNQGGGTRVQQVEQLRSIPSRLGHRDNSEIGQFELEFNNNNLVSEPERLESIEPDYTEAPI